MRGNRLYMYIKKKRDQRKSVAAMAATAATVPTSLSDQTDNKDNVVILIDYLAVMFRCLVVADNLAVSLLKKILSMIEECFSYDVCYDIWCTSLKTIGS